MEIEKEVKTFYVQYQCDECKEGSMVQTGTEKACYPPLVEHRCNECRHIEWFRNKRYPMIKHKEIEEDASAG
jgi:hypothetical protein